MGDYDFPGSCFICGNDWIVTTSCSQKPPAGFIEDEGPFVLDGDPVRCCECGAVGWITVNEDYEADVSYDELSDHNTACYHKYEGTQ